MNRVIFPCTGGHLKDAVGVCAHELADPQLAIFVARLLEPKEGALLSNLLANELLPRKHSTEPAMLLHLGLTSRLYSI